MQAPVRVATSMMASTPASTARDSPSARTRRPSASVFNTSTVLPLRMVRTSPGLVADPPGMFSVAGMMPMTLTGGARAAVTDMAPSTAAGPAFSGFLVSLPPALLVGNPPGAEGIPLSPTAAGPTGDGGAVTQQH